MQLVPFTADVVGSTPAQARSTTLCDKVCHKYNVNILFDVCLMVLNATFNNISVISWRSVLLVEETGGHGENHRPVASH
jgi:hypothetical protein